MHWSLTTTSSLDSISRVSSQLQYSLLSSMTAISHHGCSRVVFHTNTNLHCVYSSLFQSVFIDVFVDLVDHYAEENIVSRVSKRPYSNTEDSQEMSEGAKNVWKQPAKDPAQARGVYVIISPSPSPSHHHPHHHHVCDAVLWVVAKAGATISTRLRTSVTSMRNELIFRKQTMHPPPITVL